MKNYTGTKTVNATPMSRLAYNTLRNWVLPADENGEDEGYLVEYTDGGKPNHPAYAGYISWSPKEQFDRAYLENVTSVAQDIEATGKTAPRITPADIQANIVSEHFLIVGQAVRGKDFLQGNLNAPEPHPSLDLLTICVLVLANGFTVTGESACASPENFDEAIGCKIARAAAEQKIWMLMGYELKTALARPKLTEADAAADLAGIPRPS